MKDASKTTKRSGYRRIFLNLGTIQNISVAAALVLAAEIDRWQETWAVTLRLKNYRDWSPSVKALLSDIGFFELLKTPMRDTYRNLLPKDTVSVLRISSCSEMDGEILAGITGELERIAKLFKQDPIIYGALVEAVYNGVLHGYPDDYEYKYPPLRKRWWATASWAPAKQTVRFIVYDQGVGIHATLPKWKHWEKVRARLDNLPGATSTVGKYHSTMIEAALNVARSARGDGHGKGFSDIVLPVDEIEGSRLRILSGKGELLYEHGGKRRRTERQHHVGGTLLEWTFPVGQDT